MQLDLLEIPSISQNPVDDLAFQTKPFRTLHYLGSKLRMLEFIKTVADDEDPSFGAICDLFSGSGSVSHYLSNYRRIVSVDIQEYSKIICGALLAPCADRNILKYAKSLSTSSARQSLERALHPVINYEKEAVALGKIGKLDSVCDFLENCSIYSAIFDSLPDSIPDLKSALSLTVRKLNKLDGIDAIASIYFGGIYFSFEQAAHIDVLLYEIKRAPREFQNTLMAALLSTTSDLVNSVGKQFAQPVRPRNKNGKPKKTLISQLSKDRDCPVFDNFEKWVAKYSELQQRVKGHEVFRMDYKDALEDLADDVSIIYADPPYTRDHYSRFYHGLETLALQDKPVVSKTKIGGTLRLSRGLYRQDRHQSPFCIKSQAPNAFHDLFKIASSKKKILLLSYSPFDEDAGAHPRVMRLEQLVALAKNYFSVVKTLSPGIFSHNKLNHSEKHLKASNFGEILLVCRN